MCLFYSIFLEEEAYYCLYLLKLKKKKSFYNLFLFGFKEMMLFSSRSLTLSSYIN